MKPFKIGIIADCFKLGPRAGVKKAKSLGADGVQLWAVSGEMSPERMNRHARKELRKFCDELAIEISALCGDLGGHGFERADRNPLKVARSMRIVDLAADLGSKVVTTHIGVVPEDKSTETYQAMLSACRELGEYARNKDVTFAIETGPEKAVVLKSFLDDVGAKGIGVNMDPANLVMVTADDPAEAVHTLSDYIVHTHAKDGRQLAPCDPVEVYGAFAEGGVEGLDMGTLFEELPLGRGDVDWDGYLKALEDIGYGGYLTIEREVGENPVVDITAAVKFLKKKFGRPEKMTRSKSGRQVIAVKPDRELRVGIVGLGFMGKTHFNAYSAIQEAEVVALADIDGGKRSGGFLQSQGNIQTTRGIQTDLSSIRTYSRAEKMYEDPDIDVVDIALPTFLHAEHAIKALEAGKHVICEKPIATSSKEAAGVIQAAKKAKRSIYVAHCVRFWPTYVKAREMVKSKTYGKLITANFARLSSTPLSSWENWLQDPKKSGSVAMDLHIHDADFIVYMLGKPKSVTCQAGGFKKGRTDHIMASYQYGAGQLITAEGAWEYASSFGFSASFRIAMEKATIELQPVTGKLMLHPVDGESVEIDAGQGDAYVDELAHFIECIKTKKKSKIATAETALASVKLIEAELKSVETGKPVKVKI